MLGPFLMSLKHWNDIFSLNIQGVVLEESCFSSTDWTVRPAALTQSVPGVLLGGCEFRAKFLVQKCQHGSKPSQSPIGNLLSILMINGIVLWMYHVAGILILHSAMQINLFFLLLRAFTCVERRYHPFFARTSMPSCCVSAAVFLSGLCCYCIINWHWHPILACFSEHVFSLTHSKFFPLKIKTP